MRVLHLANHCHEIGNGIMNVAVDLACKQAEGGHTLGFASAGGSFVDLMARYGVRHFEIEQPWRQPLKLARAAVKLRRLLTEFKPDIVHAHMMTGAIIARTVRLRSQYCVITTVHNEWQRSAIMMGVGDRVIAVSAVVAQHMHRRGIPLRKLRVVVNGPLGSPRRASLVRPGNFVGLRHPAVLTVAGLNHRKGIRELIGAFCLIADRFPNACLYIVGDGPDREEFEAEAKATPCADRIYFLGFIPDPRAYVSQADVFVLASHKEPFGLVIAEAREAGCAIIASDVDGIPEALEGGRAGILVPPRDANAIAEVLVKLLSAPDELSMWRKRASENLGWLQLSRASDETVAIYRDALAERKQRSHTRAGRPTPKHEAASPSRSPGGATIDGTDMRG